MTPHYVHQHHQLFTMGLVDQRAQLLGAAVGVLRGVGQYTVVAPVALARELPQGHQLYCADTQRGKLRQLPGYALVTIEQAYVQLLNDRLVPGAA